MITTEGRIDADYEYLTTQQKLAQWQAWLVKNKGLNDWILQRNNGQYIDVDTIWEASRADLEERLSWL